MRQFGDWRGYSGIMTELGPMMWCSNHDKSSVLIGLHSDKIVMCRWPHGGVAVPEARNKSVNTAKDE